MRTRKKYYLKTPGKILIAAAAILAVLFIFRRPLSAVKRFLFSGAEYSNADFGIADYISPNDRDGDGIDDQTDILNGARDYIATKPEYKSAYYEGGWPNDGYGVCTDVVARALLAAGYDLQALVDGDIKASPESYDSDCGDPNIDFRRVRNLLVYFKRHATELTADIDEIDQWQGGDIIIFEGHIGIISDKRNVNGVPYLIHHGGANGKGSRLRPGYEEDVLELRTDIVGHFRMG